MDETVLPVIQQNLLNQLSETFGNTLVRLDDLRWREYGLAFKVQPADAFGVFQKLKTDDKFQFDMLVDLTCVDWMDRRELRFEVVYQLLSLSLLHRLCIKIDVSEDSPEVDSVRSLWASANFMEREAWDMFGVLFRGHGDLRRMLMYDEFVGHPLRKDYPKQKKQARVPLRIPELENSAKRMRREELVSLPGRKLSVSER